MKKLIYIIPLILLLALLAACGAPEETTAPPTVTTTVAENFASDIEYETVARGNNYHLYRVVGRFELCCEVYDSDGEIVFNETTQRPMTVSEITPDLIEIRVGYGTGISGCRYFSVEKNQISEEFFSVIATSGTQIAYLTGDINDRKLIVRDIYQLTDDCKSFELDFSPDNTPVVDAEFADDGSVLQITYMKGQSNETTETILELLTACGAPETTTATTAEVTTVGQKIMGYPIPSSYLSGNYIEKTAEIFSTDVNGESCFYIPEWEKSFPITKLVSIGATTYEHCSAVFGDTAWYFQYEHEKTGEQKGISTIITMLVIDAATGEQTKSEISLPVYIYDNFGEMFCNMIDENKGFLFVFEYGNSQISLSCLMKTEDGGESWSAVELGANRYSSYWRDIPIVAHFFDEDNGIIVSRALSGGSAGHVMITTDGGRSWETASIPYRDYDAVGGSYSYAELADFGFENGNYILTMKISHSDSENREYISFRSADLKNWVFVS